MLTPCTHCGGHLRVTRYLPTTQRLPSALEAELQCEICCRLTSDFVQDGQPIGRVAPPPKVDPKLRENIRRWVAEAEEERRRTIAVMDRGGAAGEAAIRRQQERDRDLARRLRGSR